MSKLPTRVLLIGVQAAQNAADSLIKRTPFGWLATQFGAKVVEDRLEDIVAAYEDAIRSH